MKRRVLVVAALIERGGEVLVARRKEKGERAGLWEFPGGKVEAGEGERAALARELREELGVRVQVGELYERLGADLAGMFMEAPEQEQRPAA